MITTLLFLFTLRQKQPTICEQPQRFLSLEKYVLLIKKLPFYIGVVGLINRKFCEERNMGVAEKGRRKFTVSDKRYVWYVELENDSPFHILNIMSEDKALILSCPVKTDTQYIISKGNMFQNKRTKGIWNRYLLPFHVPDIITPKFVSDVILWATQSEKAKEIKWNGKDVPV